MKSKGIVWALGIFFWLLVLILSGWAAERKPTLLGKTAQEGGALSAQPLRITSQQLEADNQKQVIIFTGNIIARQGDLVIHADTALFLHHGALQDRIQLYIDFIDLFL